jgi:hypothetical protein
MKMTKVLTTIAVVMVVLFAGCKKDTYKENVGLCPLVVSTDPANLATGVPLNKIITAKFNKKMSPGTVTPTSFTIESGAKGMAEVAGAVSCVDSVATFVPSANLLPNTTYTGTLKNTIKDLDGNSLQENYIWTFSTGSIPAVILANPLNLATNVTLNKVVQATFSEVMDPLTITGTSFTLMNGLIPVTGAVTYTGSIASFTPAANLLPATVYTATVTTGAKNLLGIPMASNFVWTFNTGAAPTVTSTDPLNNATGVLFNKVVTAVFSENMDPLTITGTTVSMANGVTPVTGAVSYAGNTMSFTPSANLLPGTLYTMTITTGAKNLTAIPLAANYVWSFTTANVPTVILTDPLNLAINVPVNKVVTATFSELMDQTTITATSFTLMNGVLPVAGAVTYAGSMASFTPTVNLLGGTTYTATVTTLAKNVAGVPMASNYVWTFTTVAAVTYTLNVTAVNGTVVKNPSQLSYANGTLVQLTATPDAGYSFTSWSGDLSGVISPGTILMNSNKNVTANFTLIAALCPTIVDLGLSGDYVILSQAGISTTGTTAITGNMGISPMTSTGITGDWALVLPSGGAFSTSTRVTGNIYAPDYALPTPTNLTTAITNMTTAFTTANGVAPTVPAELGGGTLSGNTLVAGVYKWGTSLNIATGITLDGGGDNCATFIFQIASDLIVANGVKITLQNGAQAKNIFWVVAGSTASLGTTAEFSGNILCKGLISLNTGAKVTGRLLSQTAVTLDAVTVILP